MKCIEKTHTKKMYKYKELFDLSNFPKSSKYYCDENKKIVGKMKDEYSGKSILKFEDLKSKMYSILDESSNEKSTNKGHNAFIEFQEFHDTLFPKKILRHQMRGIKSKNHNLGTYKTNKISLYVLVTKDIFSEMKSKHLHIDIKTYKND